MSARFLAAVSLLLMAITAGAFHPSPLPEVSNLDRRAPSPVDPGKVQGREQAELGLRARIPRVRIDRHEVIGSPKWIVAEDGFLTGPNGEGRAVTPATRQRFAANDPHAAVKGFGREHAALFGHDESALENARVTREFTTRHNGLHTVVWQQEHEGISIFEGTFTAHTTANGELVNVASHFLPDPALAAMKGMPNRIAAAPLPVTAGQAVVLALQNLGADQPLAGVIAVNAAESAEQRQKLRAAAAKGDIDARLVWLPLSDTAMRLCWEVFFTSQARGEMFRVLIDSETGEVWVRHCLTSYASNASFRVVGGESPTPLSPGYPFPGSNTQPATVVRSFVTLTALDLTASPNGWINDGVNETLGNNVDAHLDLDDNNVPDLPRPQGSPSRDFDFPLNLNGDPSTYRNAAVVNLFYWCNWMHDKLYGLGFTEAAGNFQTSNFGKGGVGNDAVQADAQDGGGFNNANFGTGADGTTARMQMYVYDGPNPHRDGDLDVTVVLHEYTHGLSGRLVGGGAGITALQTGGMGEGWSDFYSLSLLSGPADSLAGSYPFGAYTMQGFVKWGSFANSGDNYYFGSRRYPYSTNLNINPLTFRDIDPAQIDPHAGVPKSPIFPGNPANEVHSIGEVWCMILWEARTALIGKLGYNSGNQLILQIVTDAMKLGPANPTFVQARDAILQAEQIDSGGANKNELWAAFARRGLGADAIAPQPNTTSGLIESFNVPDTLKLLPINEVNIYGPAGGPFSFVSTNYALSNSSAVAVSWTASMAQPFGVSPLSGTLAAHAKTTLTVSLNAGQVPIAITNLQAFLLISNQTSHVTQSRRFTIHESEPLFLQTPGFGVDADIFTGPQGGPFKIIFDGSYQLTNMSASTMAWTALPPAPFMVSPGSGFLAAHASVTLDVAVGPAGSQLPIGDYTNILVISNLTTHGEMTRKLELRIRNDSYLTKLYATDPLNIPNKTISFYPQNTPIGYAVCVEPAVGFPTDPSGGTQLHHTAYTYDDNAEVFLSGGKQVSLYGHASDHVWVNFNGSVTLDSADDPYPQNTFQEHFNHLQVSGMYDNYYDGYALDAGAIISWKQTSDRFAATWQKMVNGYNGSYTNYFQTELFFNGLIRITLLTAREDFTTVGISRGLGVPGDFIDTDFASRPTCDAVLPDLFVTAPASAKEGNLFRPGAGRVSVLSPVAATLVVSLSSSDTTEIKVPASVIIPAGATSAVFNITVVDDLLLDGTRLATITASAPFYNSGQTGIFVHDNETATLHMELTNTLVENGGFVQGKVFTTVPVDDDIPVLLGSSPPGELLFSGIFPFTIIQAGQTSAVFHVEALDNRQIDGTRFATVSASVENWTDVTNTVQILDDETTNLTVLIPIFLGEGAGVLSNVGEVRLSGTVPTNVSVSFYSNLGFDLIPIGPVTIPAGQTNAHFSIYVGDNGIIDPIRLATVTGTAPGFADGVGGAFLFDNDGPPDPWNPYPPDQSDNVPVNVNLSWGRVEGELAVNGDFETGDLTGWTRADAGAGGFVVNNGTYDPASSDGPLAPYAGNFSALSEQLGNGHHELWQDIPIPHGATTVTVTWADRIRNHAGQFVPGQQQFRVEARDPMDNHVLWTLYASQPGDPLLNDWVQRTNYLSAYKGTTVRLAFVQDDQLGYLNVHLDNISVQAGSPAPTSFDVYFGTNAVPDASDYVGSTSNSFWNLPLLAAGTDFYWRIDVKRAGMTNTGPVWTFRTAGVSSNATLVGFNSSWKYWAQGTDLGTAWHNDSYSDAAWPSGLGILGFGGKENTTIGQAANGYVTFYFRKQIVLTNVARISDLTAQLIRDDGAIVYINGSFAFSDNMSGRVNYLTQAATIISGAAETTPVVNGLSPALLVNGTNTIAVEVHQKHGTLTYSPDLLFDFALFANFNVGNEAPAITLTAPANFSVVQAPTNLALQALVTDDNPAGLTVDFYADGLLIGSDSSAPYTMTWTKPVPGDYTLTAIATDSGSLSATSAPVHVVVTPASGLVSTLIPPGSVWRYRDTGQDLGVTWSSLHYNDSTWKSGPAKLGYGHGDEATVLNEGPSIFTHYITYYFRQTFTNSMNVSNLLLRVLRDDGVVVYLNGAEIWRNNMPAGAINYLTLASTNVGGAGESTFYSMLLPPGSLVNGVNLLAAEVHQASVLSGDLSFDLELNALGTTKPTVVLSSPNDSSVFLTPTNVQLASIAQVVYASIAKVEFFADGVSLGVLNNPPYQIPWPNPPTGSHMLTAVATDSNGSTNTSAPAFITALAPASLQLQQNAGQFQLAWPTGAGNYHVDSATNLIAPVSWMPLTNTVQQSNGFFVVPVDLALPEKFFRLRGP